MPRHGLSLHDAGVTGILGGLVQINPSGIRTLRADKISYAVQPDCTWLARRRPAHHAVVETAIWATRSPGDLPAAIGSGPHFGVCYMWPGLERKSPGQRAAQPLDRRVTAQAHAAGGMLASCSRCSPPVRPTCSPTSSTSRSTSAVVLRIAIFVVPVIAGLVTCVSASRCSMRRHRQTQAAVIVSRSETASTRRPGPAGDADVVELDPRRSPCSSTWIGSEPSRWERCGRRGRRCRRAARHR